MTKCDLNGIISYIQTVFNHPDSIPLHEPRFLGNEKTYIADCIDSTFVSSVGKYVDQFETMVANYTGANYAVAMVNGTAALHIGCVLAGVSPNTEVLTQPITFVATCNAIDYCQAFPTFIDIDATSLGMSSEKLEYFLRHSTKKTQKGLINTHTNRPISACIPMHTFGHPVKIDEIVAICNHYDLPVIEDSSEALGSLYRSQHVGTYGICGIFSFNGNKTITTGGGGVLVTNDKTLAERAKHLSTTAKSPHKWAYNYDEVGYNYRLPNINAALGCAQMEQLERFLTAKRRLAKNYIDRLPPLGVKVLTEPDHSRSNYWLNSLLFDQVAIRDSFLDLCHSHSIMARPCWTPMNTLPMYTECYSENLSTSDQISKALVNIPSSVIS